MIHKMISKLTLYEAIPLENNLKKKFFFNISEKTDMPNKVYEVYSVSI